VAEIISFTTPGFMKEIFKGKLFVGMAAFLAVCIVASTVMSVCSLTSMGKVKKSVESMTGSTEDVNRENDVTIMGEYTIESTEKISDAYKKGSDAGLSDRDKETLDLASDILKEIITDDMSDYDKEKAVYDWLVKNIGQDKGLLTVIPSSGKDSDNPYGVLKYHDAVCVGYATTFRLFMQMMDIDCMVVHNTERYHTWDLVKLDGKWYHTDVYTDAELGNYANFNMNDDIASISHDWNLDFFPAADGTKYCYTFMNKDEAKDIFDIPEAVKKHLDEQNYVFAIGFEKQPVNDDAGTVNTIMNSLSDRITMDYTETYMDWNWLMDEDGKYVLRVVINNSSATSDTVTQEVAEKIGKRIAKAFGDSDSWPVTYSTENSSTNGEDAIKNKINNDN
jgi:hypothetical protein